MAVDEAEEMSLLIVKSYHDDVSRLSYIVANTNALITQGFQNEITHDRARRGAQKAFQKDQNILTNDDIIKFKADLVDDASLVLGRSKLKSCHFLRDSGLLLVL